MPFIQGPKDDQYKPNKKNTYKRKTFLPSFWTGHIQFGQIYQN